MRYRWREPLSGERRSTPLKPTTAAAHIALALLASGCGGRPPQPPAPEQELLAHIGEILKQQASSSPQLVLTGDVLQLGETRLKLEVSTPRDLSPGKALHVHLLTRSMDATSPALDACVAGVGVDENARVRDAAQYYTDIVLPPVLSAFTGQLVRGVTPFYGDGATGPSGASGFLGGYILRGDLPQQAIDQANLFEGVQLPPLDGQRHLIKATVHCAQGACERIIELDGGADPLLKAPWKADTPTPNAGMVIQFATYQNPPALNNPTARADAIRLLDAAPAWLPTTGCPADIMPSALLEGVAAPQACEGGRLMDCVAECERGDRTACYNAAQHLEHGEHSSHASALYLRACKLGEASGCTNAAASRRDGDKPFDACSLRSFERTCDLSGDPWACTMIGAALVRGAGIERDVARGKDFLLRSCRYGESDPACRTSLTLLSQSSP